MRRRGQAKAFLPAFRAQNAVRRASQLVRVRNLARNPAFRVPPLAPFLVNTGAVKARGALNPSIDRPEFANSIGVMTRAKRIAHLGGAKITVRRRTRAKRIARLGNVKIAVRRRIHTDAHRKIRRA